MDKVLPLVSVVIPMYQAEGTIVKALDSVVRQHYRPIQIIVVNDGSTDRSLVVAQHFIAQHQAANLQFMLIDKPNGGASSARNAGMKQAKGTYIALLDADDEWLPHKLSRQIQLFEENPTIDFMGTTRNGHIWKRWLFKPFHYLTPISSRLLLYKTFFVTPTVVFKRSILHAVGYFDENQKYAEEGDYWIRVCQHHQCVLVNESMAITGGGKPNFGFSGLSSNLKGMEKGELKNMKTGYQLGIVGKAEYLFLVMYSLIKYLRRIIVVKFR